MVCNRRPPAWLTLAGGGAALSVPSKLCHNLHFEQRQCNTMLEHRHGLRPRANMPVAQRVIIPSFFPRPHAFPWVLFLGSYAVSFNVSSRLHSFILGTRSTFSSARGWALHKNEWIWACTRIQINNSSPLTYGGTRGTTVARVGWKMEVEYFVQVVGLTHI